jgi:hypothetical protein
MVPFPLTEHVSSLDAPSGRRLSQMKKNDKKMTPFPHTALQPRPFRSLKTFLQSLWIGCGRCSQLQLHDAQSQSTFVAVLPCIVIKFVLFR